MNTFRKAEKKGLKLRLGLIGPSGSGKTYTALNIAKYFGGPIAVIDTEHRSAERYADEFEFDTCPLEDFSPLNYISNIEAAAANGYNVLIIDSLSHAWSGKGGILEYVDIETEKAKSKNSFSSGWRKATPLHNSLIDKILAAPIHIIATMRSKVEYVMVEENGKKFPKKVGLAPVQREGMEYEFDIVGDMDNDNRFVESKTRCKAIKGKLFDKPGRDFAKILLDWLGDQGNLGDTYSPKASAEEVKFQSKLVPATNHSSAIASALDDLRHKFMDYAQDKTPAQISVAIASNWNNDVTSLNESQLRAAIAKWSKQAA